MSKDNLIFNAYKLYLKEFEPYTYKITLKNNISILIVSPKDRFPHLIGLETIFKGEKATDSIINLENNDEKYKISEIKKSFKNEYKKVKRKINFFYHLENLFNNVSFYKIYSLSGKKKGSHILLNRMDKEEINLVIDETSKHDKEYFGKYIPRSFLINTRQNNFGQYVTDGTKEDIVKLEQIENKTGNIQILYYNELLEKNNKDHIKKDLTKFKFKNISNISNLINLIINFNIKANKYHSLEQILAIKLLKSFDINHKLHIDQIISEFKKQTSNDLEIDIIETDVKIEMKI